MFWWKLSIFVTIFLWYALGMIEAVKSQLSQKMFTRFERILKLFLSPLLSTFKLYNTQPNLQQKSAMVWQGFMLQVRLQRFFARLKGNSIFVPLSTAKTWKIEIAFVNEIFLKARYNLFFFGSNCAFITLLLGFSSN